MLISPDKVKEMIAQPARGVLSSGKVRLGTVACVLELPGGYAGVPHRLPEIPVVPRISRRRQGQRIDSRTLIISFAVTAIVLFVVWRFFMS